MRSSNGRLSCQAAVACRRAFLKGRQYRIGKARAADDLHRPGSLCEQKLGRGRGRIGGEALVLVHSAIPIG